jgi:hypothetical protein
MDRIGALRSDIKRFSPGRHYQALKEIKALQSLQDESEGRMIELREAIHTRWQGLKDIRSRGFSSTSVSPAQIEREIVGFDGSLAARANDEC